MDANKDGCVDFVDLTAYLTTIGETATADTVRSMILGGDIDGDGKINFDDFLALVKIVDAA
jgi:Ca2+-binding EF-hand superfamily protein